MNLISTASPEKEFLKMKLSENGYSFHMKTVGQLEEILLAMIQHWEAASGETVADPELKKLKELCKDKKLFRNLGLENNSIGQWLTDSDEPNIETRLHKMIQHCEAETQLKVTEKQMLEIEKRFKQQIQVNFKFDEYFIVKRILQDIIPNFPKREKTGKKVLSLNHFRAEKIHVWILDFIKLLDKVSEDAETAQNVAEGNFKEVKRKIEEKIVINETMKKDISVYFSNEVKEAYINSLLMKTTAETFWKIFRVNKCPKCAYKFDP
jgi:hypothetical protein